MPRISVVIPTHNYGAFVGRAIQSVLDQTQRVHELVVVDDGSTDNTADVLADFAPRITALTTQGVGVSAARNLGARHTSGDYLAFLDADDAWLPTKLERQLPLFGDVPNVGAVGCANTVYASNGDVIRTRYFPNPADDARQRLHDVIRKTSWMGSSNSGVLMKREVWDALGGFDETLVSAEDWDLWMRLAARWTFRNVHTVLCHIEFHRTGTFRDPDRMARGQWAAYAKAKARWPQQFDDATDRAVRAGIERDIAGECANGIAWLRALRHYGASLQLQPRQPDVWKACARTAFRGLRDHLRKETP